MTNNCKKDKCDLMALPFFMSRLSERRKKTPKNQCPQELRNAVHFDYHNIQNG